MAINKSRAEEMARNAENRYGRANVYPGSQVPQGTRSDVHAMNSIFIRSNPNIRIFDAESWIRRIIRLHRFVESNP